MGNNIDFLVIGAPKAGTTALYEYIKDHPQLAIPASKELPFFSENRVYKKGINWYLSQLPKKNNSISGTVTPQYLLGSMDVSVEEIADRIKHDVGDNVKLIAVLRDPLKRAFSHYKMVVRRGYEDRGFTEALSETVKLYRAGKLPFDYQSEFLYGSLYGTQMKAYYDRFAQKNILVIFAEDLRDNPEVQSAKVLEFIGADTKHWKFSGDGGVEIHKGGMMPRTKLLTPKTLKRIPGLFFMWNNVIPYPIKKRVDFGINKWNVKPDDISMVEITDESILNLFRQEIAKLEKLSGLKTPWKY